MVLIKLIILSSLLTVQTVLHIFGSPSFVSNAESAMVLLQQRYPVMFELVMYNTKNIIEQNSPTGIAGWPVGKDYIQLQNDTDIVTAGRVVHETMHILLWKNCIQPGGVWGEEFAIRHEIIAIKRLNREDEYHQYDIDKYVLMLEGAIGKHGLGYLPVALPDYCEGGLH